MGELLLAADGSSKSKGTLMVLLRGTKLGLLERAIHKGLDWTLIRPLVQQLNGQVSEPSLP